MYINEIFVNGIKRGTKVTQRLSELNVPTDFSLLSCIFS